MKQQEACVPEPVLSGKLAVYFRSTAFYMTFFYICKCSFWLLCQPWYLFIYFGLDCRPLIRQTTLLQWVRGSGKFLCVKDSTTLWKYTKIIIKTPYNVVVITMWLALVGPLRLPGALKKQLSLLKAKPSSGNNAVRVCQSVEEQLVLTHPEDFQILAQHNGKLMFYKNLPLRQISYLWGEFVNLPYFPVWFRILALKYYIWLYRCKLEEAANPDLRSYKTLGAFFRRQLRKEVRPIHGGNNPVSPADGCIMHCGSVQEGLLEQVKGVTFPLKCFMGPICDKDLTTSLCFNHVIKKKSVRQNLVNTHSSNKLAPVNVNMDTLHNREYQSVFTELLLTNTRATLQYCVVYLSPGDYHRFHSPVDWTVTGRRHFTGNLYSVKPSMAAWLQGLFCVNERVLYVGRWKYGFFSMTAVGALNVGSINVFFDKTLKTNQRSSSEMGLFQDVSFVTKKHKGVSLTKGQQMGDFNLGSTIVLLFEAPPGFDFSVVQGGKVKYGQSIAK